jgi:hypothetical protein
MKEKGGKRWKEIEEERVNKCKKDKTKAQKGCVRSKCWHVMGGRKNIIGGGGYGFWTDL